MSTSSRPPKESELQTGETIASVKLTTPVSQGERVQLWRGSWPDGTPGTVHALVPTAKQREVDNFLKASRRLFSNMRAQPLAGVVPIAAVVPTQAAYVTRLSIQGTMADVPVLQWPIDDTLRFMRRMCLAMESLHGAGIIHGCLRPSNVLLDDNLSPVLSDAGAIVLDDSYMGSSDMKHDYSAYAAREVRIGHTASVRSDIFSVGRLMYFSVHGDTPDEADDEVPALDALEYAPAGLVRIIRKCTALKPDRRYPSMNELLTDLENYQNVEDVGLRHPQGLEGMDDDPVTGERSWQGEAGRPTHSGSGPASTRPGDDRGPDSTRARRVRSPQPHDTGSAADSDAAPASRRPAREAAPVAPKPRPRKPQESLYDADEDVISSTQTRIGSIVGTLLLAAGLGYSYWRGIPTTGASVATIIGAVGLSLIIPALGGSPLVIRSAAALLLGTAAWLLDPVAYVSQLGRQKQLASGSAQQRGARVQTLRGRGITDFGRLDLSGADFRDMDLSGVRFDASELVGAKFDNSNLLDVSFADSNVAQCSFNGAKLTGVSMAAARGWIETSCDAGTEMPPGWVCEDGRPLSRVTVDATGVQRQE
jgi:hypothetical protein